MFQKKHLFNRTSTILLIFNILTTPIVPTKLSSLSDISLVKIATFWSILCTHIQKNHIHNNTHTHITVKPMHSLFHKL
jgi:hypothetical protein